MQDFLGNELRIGQEIVYPVRQASKLWMCRAKITGVIDDYLRVWRLDPPHDRPLTIRCLSNVVIVKEVQDVANPE